MAKQISSLSVGLFGDITPFAQSFAKAGDHVMALGDKVGELGGKILEFSGIAAGVGAVVGAAFELKGGFELAAQIETAEVAFKGMTGSAEEAKTLLESLHAFEATTPFEFPELADVSKRFLAVGFSAQQLPGLLHEIGDVAIGTSTPIGNIAEVFTRVAEEGQVSTRTLKSLGAEGIPIVQALAKTMNTSEAGVRAMVKAGQVGLPQLQAAFAEMTSGSGRFAGMIEVESQTVGGLWKTMTTDAELGMAKISSSLIDAFDMKDALRFAITGFQTIDDAASNFITQFEPTMHSIENVVGSAFGGMAVIVQTYGGMALDAASSAWSAIYGTVAPIVSGLVDYVGANWESLVGTTVSVLSGMYDWASSLFGAIETVVSAAWSAVKDVWYAGISFITGTTQDSTTIISTSWHTVGDAVKWFFNGLGELYTAGGALVRNWQDTMDAAVYGVAYGFVKTANIIEYALVDVAWPYIEWFCKAPVNAFRALFDFTTTVFENLGSNIVAVFKNLPGLIKGSVKFGDIWTPLTTGFEVAMYNLPKIAERQKGALEESLGADYDAATNRLLTDVGTALANKEQRDKKLTGSITDKMKKSLVAKAQPVPSAAPQIKGLPTISAPELPEAAPLGKLATVSAPGTKSGVEAQEKGPELIRSGSAESQMLQYKVPPITAAQTESLTHRATGLRGLGAGKPGGKVLGVAPAGVTPDFLGATTGRPITATSPADVGGTAGAGTSSAGTAEQKLLDETRDRIGNYWLLKIEQNTRNSAQTVSI